MKIEISEAAIITLKDVADFVESKNTKGAGKRWISRFRKKIKEYAIQNVQYKFCEDQTLFELKYSCLSIASWTVVFNIENKTFKIHQIIHASLLK